LLNPPFGKIITKHRKIQALKKQKFPRIPAINDMKNFLLLKYGFDSKVL